MNSNQGMTSAGAPGRKDGLFLAAVLVLGALVQCFFLRDGLYYDECQHYLVARSPLFADFIREFKMRAHPPVSYLLIRLFLFFGDSAFAAKGLSFVCGLLGIVLAHRVLRRATGSAYWARWGALFVALLPPLVAQATEVRQYAPAVVFLWAYLGTAVGMLRGDRPARRHVLLFVLAFLAVFTVYSSVLTVGAVSLVLYGPLLWRRLRERRWAAIAAVVPAYAVLVGLMVLMLWWSFLGRPVQRTYLASSMYDGTWQGVGHVARFLLPGLWAFSRNVLGDAAILAVLVLPAIWPFGRDRPVLRALGVAAVLTIGFRVLASFIGFLPLWGLPRHTITDLPIVATAAFCALAHVLDRAGERTHAGPALRLLLPAFLVLGEVIQLASVPRSRNSYRAVSEAARIAEYTAEPAPIVCNWRGRTFASWYYLAGRTPRLRGPTPRGAWRFTYDDIELAQTDAMELVAGEAFDAVRRDGSCWVVVGYLWDGGARKARAELEAHFASAPDIRVAYAAPPFVVRPLRTIIYRLEAIPAPD